MHRRRLYRLAATASLALLGAYLVGAYVAAPEFWRLREADLPAAPDGMLTTTPQGIPGDPINVGLVGPRAKMVEAFAAAGWHPADAVTLRTAIDIGVSVVLDRPYQDAPVSSLLFDGRPQDLAFEKPVGNSADQRHHVRFWQTTPSGADSELLWLGSASFDRGVGFSHDTGQVTHHIGPDLDAERDLLMKDLSESGWLASTYPAEGVGATRTGRNGGGDLYFTDGKAIIGVLRGDR